jgi:hypothetical protein
VAVDNGGLTLIELTPEERPTGAYLEIGGSDWNAGDTEDDAKKLEEWKHKHNVE